MVAACASALLVVAILFTASASAQTEGAPFQPSLPQRSTDTGASMFKTYCATCHGPFGKGDGSFAKSLRIPPPDLRLLTKANQGIFPADRVAKSIDGRGNGKPHGTTDMPEWGDAFSRTTHDSDPESVRLKIEALVAFIRSVQEKPSQD